MNLGKKLATLLNAAIRGSNPAAKAKGISSEDPKTQLESLRQAMSDVEAKERQVAKLLEAAKVKARDAEESGSYKETAAQNRLVAELEAQLDSQSTQAISLTERLQQVEASLDAQQKEAKARAAAEEKSIRAAEAEGNEQTQSLAIPQKSTDQPTSDDDNPDLNARKSRLSG